ncbi:MAG TPA: MFS transporter, partial [Pseudonocardia sp.]|nr:MFS transporter [Pseudonocardia sp.]
LETSIVLIAVALVGIVTGSVGFAVTHAVRTHHPVPARPAGVFGALAVPGLRTVVLASLGFGLVIGTVEVGVPAVTAAAGSAALGGVLLSAWSVASVLAGVAYSLRPWPRPLHLRLPVLLLAFAVCVGAMAVAGPLPALVVAMLLAGATITPQVTAHSLGVEATAPAGTATEAFGWVVTAATLGLAAGQSMAGIVVEAAGPPAAFLASGSAGVVLAVVLWLRRGTLAPTTTPAPVAA